MQTVDTTGAGDAFLGAVLYLLKSKSLSEVRGLSAGQLEDIVGFANAADSLAMTQYGAVTASPSEEQIRACMRNVPFLRAE